MRVEGARHLALEALSERYRTVISVLAHGRSCAGADGFPARFSGRRICSLDISAPCVQLCIEADLVRRLSEN